MAASVNFFIVEIFRNKNLSGRRTAANKFFAKALVNLTGKLG